MFLFKSSKQNFSFFFFISLFLIGLGYIFTVPVFEGFDENAHFSRIRELTDSNNSIFLGHDESLMDKSIEAYQGPGPDETTDPFYKKDKVYYNFFLNDKYIYEYINNYRNNAFNAPFQKGESVNWQQQHPPLYYLLLSYASLNIKQFSLITQFSILRILSYLIALFGVYFAFSAACKNIKSSKMISQIKLGFLLYPIVLPMFFLEFARLGNDSLCIFFTGLFMYILNDWFKDDTNIKKSMMMGLVLGLGLLTKAFFFPIGLAVGFFLVYRLFRSKNKFFSIHLLNIFIFALIASIFALAWYVTTFFKTGNLGMGYIVNDLHEHGSFLIKFKQNFSFMSFLRGALMPIVTFSWIGTRSLTHLPIFFQLPLLIFLILIFLLYISKIKSKNSASKEWLPLWIFIFFYMGLIALVVANIAKFGIGASGGWYLHILMPWIAPLVGFSAMKIYRNQLFKKYFNFLVIYSAFFHLLVLWCFLSLYAGCSTKSINKLFVFPDYWVCFNQMPIILDRLNILGFGFAGIFSFLAGSFLYAYLYYSFFKNEISESK
jgi:hypothetical protein